MSVCVVGAGPAGLRAAARLSGEGHEVVVVDREARIGGQVGRQPADGSTRGPHAGLVARVGGDPRITVLTGASVVAVRRATSGFQVLTDRNAGLEVSDHDVVILATGAREVVTPFPGWELPGVVTAGAVQSLLKRDGALPWERVGLAGSGPLAMAVATDLRRQGIAPVFHVERRRLPELVRDAPGVAVRHPRKALELVRLRRGRPRRFGWDVVAADGDERVRRVVLGSAARRQVHEVDALAVSAGLVPDVTLARQLGCDTDPVAGGMGQRTVADISGATSVPGVFAAGEATGVGGVDKALAEGEVAGAAASAHTRGGVYRPTSAERGAVASGRRFASDLERLFPLDWAWPRHVPGSTLVCRCEEVPLDTVKAAIAGGAHDARSVKGVTRAGMGYCQGRVCGPLVIAALRSLGHEPRDDLESRPIASPVTLGDMARLHTSG